ncbi:kinase-like domain-containing protein [Aspergillus crustosus]
MHRVVPVHQWSLVWDDNQQLRDHFSPFNVTQLQEAAAAALGAKECVGFAKLAEGSFNKAFKFTMGDGSSAIARIPLATIDFARSVLGIPAPQVLAWSADAENPAGSEYIIMEHARGTRLVDVWDDLPLEEKIEIMQDLFSLQRKMLSVSFNRYGNLYYASDNIQGAVPAEVTGDLPTDVKETILRRFAIGPMEDLDRGPWKHPQDYTAAVAHREMKWISRFAIPKQPNDPLLSSVTQNTPRSHISLLQRYLDIAPYLFPSGEHSDVVASHLSHTDLHPGNIFVDNGRISSLIDWQETWAAPLLLLARHPRLVDYNGEIILKPPEVPLLNKAIRFEDGRTRCEPVLFAGDTWDDDLIPLRESLIKIENNYVSFFNEHCLIPCPIHFTEEELRLHSTEGEGWNEVQDFWKSIDSLVKKDGWTSNETYNDARKFFGELREAGLENLVGEEREDFERQTKWAEGVEERQ